jgi:acid phosphatase (class A)
MTLPRRHLIAAFAAFSLATTLPALAETAPYVTAEQVDLLSLLPSPPARNSPGDLADIQAVLDMQKSRGTERAALAVHDANENPLAIYGAILGEGVTAARFPLVVAFLNRVAENEDTVVDPAKKGFARPRPHLVNAEIVPIVPRSSSGSYPSGHTTRGTLVGLVLVKMLPEKREAIMARIEEYGQSRLVAGIHYPADIEAGFRAGTATAAVMMTMPTFQADLAAARAELRQGLGLTP